MLVLLPVFLWSRPGWFHQPSSVSPGCLASQLIGGLNKQFLDHWNNLVLMQPTCQTIGWAASFSDLLDGREGMLLIFPRCLALLLAVFLSYLKRAGVVSQLLGYLSAGSRRCPTFAGFINCNLPGAIQKARQLSWWPPTWWALYASYWLPRVWLKILSLMNLVHAYCESSLGLPPLGFEDALLHLFSYM